MLSGVTYDRPDSTYGPFNWTVTEGGGKLETAEDVNVNGTRKNVAWPHPLGARRQLSDRHHQGRAVSC